MPVQIEAPNGEIVEFPDGTPDDVMAKAMRETYGGPQDQTAAPMNMATSGAKGLLSPGNIDLAKRPVVKNPDGSISTVRSMSFEEDGKEVLVPTVSPDGRILSEDDAINLYHQTGQHLGMFDNPDDATAYAETLHNQQAGMYAQDPKTASADRDKFYSSGIYAGSMNPLGPIAKSIDAFASGAQRAPLMGWDDEAAAAASVVGGGDYTANQQKFDQQKQVMRDQNPVASIAGELTGGLATGGTIASTGATLAGRSLPVIGRAGGAALEGAAYGAATGAGEAKPGERAQGAAIGALIGAPIGAFGSKAVDILASSSARKASNAIAPSAEDIKAASQAIYQQADQAGVTVKPQVVDHLIKNIEIVAGSPNANLRPKTLGMVQDAMALKGQPMTLGRLHELRQEIDLAVSRAEPSDERTLMRMRDVVEGFIKNAKPAYITGNVDGFKYLKQADKLWAQQAKAQKIETLFDLADVESAKYSQSGMSNAIRLKAKQLYTRIAKGQEKSFTMEETALIRKLSKGEMTPKVVEFAAKFAPRGVISFGAGVGLGSAVGGPVGAVLPGMIGYGAATMADRAAVGGVNALRNAAATGRVPVLGAISNKSVPFIGGSASQAVSQIQRGR